MATNENNNAEGASTAANSFYTAADSRRERWEDNISSTEKDLKDLHKSAISLQSQIKEINGKKLGERVEFGQKLLGLGGQTIAGLAITPKAKEALQSVGLVAQLLTATSMTFIGAAFASNARRSVINTHTESLKDTLGDIQVTKKKLIDLKAGA